MYQIEACNVRINIEQCIINVHELLNTNVHV